MKQQSAASHEVNVKASPMRYVPNALSLMRIGLAMAFPFLPPHWRLPVVLLAGVSDVADGVIARRFNVASHAGALLDAIADKLFVLTVLLTLVFIGPVLWWQVALILLRDFAVAVVAGYATLSRDWPAFQRMRPDITGKIATGFIFAWLVTVTAGWDVLQTPLFVLAAAASALAAGAYLRRFTIALRERRETA
jgi:cardiolipin synthase (CMP-forming)